MSGYRPKFMQWVNNTVCTRLMPSANEVEIFQVSFLSACLQVFSNPNLDILKATKEMCRDSLFQRAKNIIVEEKVEQRSCA